MEMMQLFVNLVGLWCLGVGESAYDSSVANILLHYSGASYCLNNGIISPDEFLSHWDCDSCAVIKKSCISQIHGVMNTGINKNLASPPTEAMALVSFDKCLNAFVVAFKGTDDATSAFTDMSVSLKNVIPYAPESSCDSCKVHGGFQDAYDYIREMVMSSLRDTIKTELQLTKNGFSNDGGHKLYITGHSLGGAMATLLFHDIIEDNIYFETIGDVLQFDLVSIYTFGSPRVGNKEFVSEYGTLMEDCSDVYISTCESFRITYGQDGVTQLPPLSLTNYLHVPHELYYPEFTAVPSTNDWISATPIDCNDSPSAEDTGTCINSFIQFNTNLFEHHSQYFNSDRYSQCTSQTACELLGTKPFCNANKQMAECSLRSDDWYVGGFKKCIIGKQVRCCDLSAQNTLDMTPNPELTIVSTYYNSYKVAPPVTWTEANNICKNKVGTALATIVDTTQLHDALSLFNKVLSQPDRQPWVGLMKSGNQWCWISLNSDGDPTCDYFEDFDNFSIDVLYPLKLLQFFNYRVFHQQQLSEEIQYMTINMMGKLVPQHSSYVTNWVICNRLNSPQPWRTEL